MNSESNEMKALVREEVSELLDDFCDILLDLEEKRDDTELVNRAFRDLHTIKGTASMFGFEAISRTAHELETQFDKIRSGQITFCTEIISVSLAAVDLIIALLDDKEEVDWEQHWPPISEALNNACAKKPGDGEPALMPKEEKSAPPLPAPEPSGAKKIFRIRYKPHQNTLLLGLDPLAILADLQKCGDCAIVAETCDIPDLEQITLDHCYLSWTIILTTDQESVTVKDVFIFAEDKCELSIELIEEYSSWDEGEVEKRLGEILIERGDIDGSTIEKALDDQKRLGEILIDTERVTPDAVTASLAEQQHVKESKWKMQTERNVSTVRVTAHKIDELVNLVGELITVQAQLSQTASQRNDQQINVIAEEVERLIARLRENTMSIRMLPVGSLFGKFKRVVRELSLELGKEVEFITKGNDTELDKTVIEQLGDPLMHLVRNCVDHGIELPAQREAAGKPSKGSIILEAIHSGDHVEITITDDGQGMDSQAIRKSAIAKNLIQEQAILSEDEMLSLVFLPGFSTAAEITKVSGRGVGMDVVKRNIESLRGTIDLKSTKGQGARISLKIPLTLAIIDGLLVGCGMEKYIIPLSSVVECFEQTAEDMAQAHGHEVIVVRGQMVPYICLRHRFNTEGQPPMPRRVIVCEADDKKIGLAVDRVIGTYQTVIKPLGQVYRTVNCVSGATILGDGSVALIVDPLKMFKEKKAAYARTQ